MNATSDIDLAIPSVRLSVTFRYCIETAEHNRQNSFIARSIVLVFCMLGVMKYEIQTW